MSFGYASLDDHRSKMFRNVWVLLFGQESFQSSTERADVPCNNTVLKVSFSCGHDHLDLVTIAPFHEVLAVKADFLV